MTAPVTARVRALRRPDPAAVEGSRPAGADDRTPLGGTVLAVLLSLGTCAGALIGLGSIAQYLYPLACAGVAALLLLQRRHAGFLEFALWLWFLSPEVRRVVDWRTGWHPVSYVMVAAPLATVLCLLPALRNVRPVHRSAVLAFTVFLVALGYATAVGVVRTGPAAPAADVLQWLPPVALGVWIANSELSTRDLRRALTRTAVAGGVVLGLYALVQFVLLPPWDSYWFENAPLGSLGSNEPFEVRVWSLLNSPGPFATVLLALMALVLASRSPLRWVSFGLSAVGIGLSLVRAAWAGFVVLLLVLVTRMKKASAAVIAATALLLVVMAALGGPVYDAIAERFDTSVQSGSSDVSFTERLAFHVEMLPVILADPVGQGLGASGVATKLDNAGDLGTRGDFDGGALQVLFAFGPLVGTAVLVTVLLAVLAAWARSREQEPLFKVCAAAAVALVSQLVFGNPFTSVSGVVLWVVLGVVARDRSDEQDDAAGAPAPARHVAAPALAPVRRR
ncbi:hypothetical protein [Kineococcus sp. SYSU DK005]|uniref:hypothetical protein n=1 Tax=Kineococcus sp. SYSU DK005 TaxID=3383126 RepID=UPI003D7EC375